MVFQRCRGFGVLTGRMSYGVYGFGPLGAGVGGVIFVFLDGGFFESVW